VPRAGLSTAAVVDAALEVVDEQGAAALTLAAVAARTGVAAPSLYKHVAGLAGLRDLVGVRVLEDMADRFARVAMGRAGDAAVAALMHEYRAYVREYPARYTAMPHDPLHAGPAQVAAGGRLIEVLFAVLRGYGLTGSAAVHAARCLRAVVHGFADIEAAGGFGLAENVDESYAHLIEMFVNSLPREEIP